MNQVLWFITVLVIFVYFGGSNVPKVLKDNKQILLGVVGGLVLYSSMGMGLEGLNHRQIYQCYSGTGPFGARAELVADDTQQNKWEALTDEEQGGATALGWSRKNWNCVWNMWVVSGHRYACDLPDSDDKYWKDLSTAEQEGATALGWSADHWDC